jgi:hypothetical protein
LRAAVGYASCSLASSRWLAQAKVDFKAKANFKADKAQKIVWSSSSPRNSETLQHALVTGVRADCRDYWVGACT